jgi:hypothetical protein
MAGSKDPAVFVFGTNWLKSRRGSEAKPYFGCSGADAVEQNAGRIVAQVLLLRADGAPTPESLVCNSWAEPRRCTIRNRSDSFMHI